MKLTRDKLKQIIKEELEEMMTVDEADIKVSVSAEDQKLKKDLERVAGYTGAQVLKVDGKMYVCQRLNSGKISVHDGNDMYVKYLDSSGRTEKPKPVEDPQVLAKVSSMLQTKPSKRR
jgi:RNA-binding protein YhbY